MKICTTQSVFALSALALLGFGCGPAPVPDARPQGASVDVVRYFPPQRSVYIRAGFDSDPSRLMGNFLRNDLPADEIDENRAARTTCSKYITTTVIPAGGTYNHTLNASREVQANLAVQPFGSAGAGASDAAGIQVSYALEKKMVHEIDDLDGFSACCENAPDQCGNLMVGEFWYGSGSIMEFAGSESDVKASGGYQVASGDFSFKGGWAWKKTNEWTDQYFAFRTQESSLGGSGLCGRDYVNQIPLADDGKFFVGVAPPSASESKARELAMRDAQAQVVRYLGTNITEVHGSASSAMAGILADQTLVEAAAQGIASKIKDRCWRPVEITPGPDQFKTIKVLAFYPEAELQADQRAVVDAMTKEAERSGKAPAAANLKKIADTLSSP